METLKKALNELSGKYGGTVYYDHLLKDFSTMGVGGPASAFYVPDSIDEFVDLVGLCHAADIPLFVLGNGSNVLFKDSGFKGVVVTFHRSDFKRMEITEQHTLAGAGVTIGELIFGTAKHGLSGFEGLVGVPASVGGALMMNASYKSAISDNLERVLLFNMDKGVSWVEKDEMTFDYRYASFSRGDIILEAIFRVFPDDEKKVMERTRHLFNEKAQHQPLGKKSLGCVFKNPEGAEFSSGVMIEKAGLKGKSKGGAKISEMHANFIINTGEATSADVLYLIEEAKAKVYKEFSVELEEEIEIVG